MRKVFIKELSKLSNIKKNIYLIINDLGYNVIEPFSDKFPKRFFNAGVSEQNMMGMSAGIASEKCHVFVYSIANFIEAPREYIIDSVLCKSYEVLFL